MLYLFCESSNYCRENVVSDDKTARGSSRRLFIKASVLGGVVAAFSRTAGSAGRSGHSPTPTPSEIEGPFYPLTPQKDKDFDLTRIRGRSGVAKGRIIFVEGQVLDTEGNPIEDATVDLWQANAAGRYWHQRDQNRAPLDPNFQGWAIVQSERNGQFRFKTVFPGQYPAAVDWIRPPHIHFKISKPGFRELVTQMYFPGQPLNDVDLLLMQKSDAEARRMIAEQVEGNPERFRYTPVLERV
jgi:protocatechuate 3,4-dioxygenase beta subunit